MILALHVMGALGFFASGVGVVLRKVSRNVMRGFVVFEFITGTYLSVMTASTFVAYCAKMGIYLAFWLAIEAWAIHTSRRVARQEQL